jgi:hypothetical protein
MAIDNFQHLFNTQTKEDVINKIQSLTHAVDKIKCWYENGLRWLELYDSTAISGIDLEPFKFKIPETEYEQVNNWIIENYLQLAWGTIEEKTKKFLILHDLTDDFENRFKEKPEKRTIRREIDFVEDSFKTVNLTIHRSSFPMTLNETFNAEKSSFDDIVQNDKAPDYSKIYQNPLHTIRLRNGFILGQYFLYLEDFYESPKKAKPKTKELTLSQQLLTLHYLGITEMLLNVDNNKKAEFLSLLISKSEQNIREKFSNFGSLKFSTIKSEKEKIKKDLGVVLEEFKKIGLKKQQKLIASDIEKLVL